MIIKVIGNNNGMYRERTWEEVEDYLFTNEHDGELEDIVFNGDRSTPYSHLKLMFAKRDPVYISFNTKAFVMTQSTGKTVDVLHYDPRKG